MGYRPVGISGELVKWDRDGTAVEGTWKGSRQGQYGELGTVDALDGRVLSFPLTTALQSKLALVKEGARVRITFLGMRRSGEGKDYKDFSVEEWEDEAQQALPETPGAPF